MVPEESSSDLPGTGMILHTILNEFELYKLITMLSIDIF